MVWVITLAGANTIIEGWAGLCQLGDNRCPRVKQGILIYERRENLNWAGYGGMAGASELRSVVFVKQNKSYISLNNHR